MITEHVTPEPQLSKPRFHIPNKLQLYSCRRAAETPEDPFRSSIRHSRCGARTLSIKHTRSLHDKNLTWRHELLIVHTSSKRLQGSPSPGIFANAITSDVFWRRWPPFDVEHIL